jgi:hypothetical protein
VGAACAAVGVAEGAASGALLPHPAKASTMVPINAITVFFFIILLLEALLFFSGSAPYLFYLSIMQGSIMCFVHKNNIRLVQNT